MTTHKFARTLLAGPDVVMGVSERNLARYQKLFDRPTLDGESEQAKCDRVVADPDNEALLTVVFL